MEAEEPIPTLLLGISLHCSEAKVTKKNCGLLTCEVSRLIQRPDEKLVMYLQKS